MKKLHRKTIEKIAEAVCGAGDLVDTKTFDPENFNAYDSDTTRPFTTPFPLREQPDLEAFLRDSGVEFDAPKEEIHDRKEFVLGLLTPINGTSELERVITGLADPRENDDDQEVFQECLTRLNDILRLEGLQVEMRGVDPRLVECEATMNRPAKEAIIDATPDFGRLVQNDEMASVLKFRWEEAQRCVQAKAYLAAIVIMGSLLEGVLLAKIQAHPGDANTAKSAPRDHQKNRARRFRDWGLSAMIDVAHEKGWIRGDVKEFSHAIRNYRNLVHPAESAKLEKPDRGTCEMSRTAVKLAIRNLSDDT